MNIPTRNLIGIEITPVFMRQTGLLLLINLSTVIALIGLYFFHLSIVINV